MTDLMPGMPELHQEKELVPLRQRHFSDDEEVVVSICSITYNHSNYIRQCMEGFLDQVCPFRVEIVIYDDASTDGASDILREYMTRYPTIVRAQLAERNSYSLGLNPYYAFVLPKARGRYVAICDGDDFWIDSRKLAKQVDFLERNPETVITYGPTLTEIDGVIHEGRVWGAHRDLSEDELKAGASINTLTACFRNPYLQVPPPFLKKAPVGDMTLWALLGYHGSGKFLNELLPAVYRVHDGGVFSKQDRGTKQYMSLLCHVSIAGYHNGRGDLGAERALLGKALTTIVRRLGFKGLVFEGLRRLKPFIVRVLRINSESIMRRG